MQLKSYQRWQEKLIEQALSSRRVLLLTGPRQCGKTTLVKNLLKVDKRYYTLDDTTLLESAKNDPTGFIKHGNELLIIDEIQRAPILLQAIKQDVDENQAYGRYLLTGSAHIPSLPETQESLAGRVRKMRLRPLALGEISGTTPCFIQNAFREKFQGPQTENLSKDNYLDKAFLGGYPEAIRMKTLQQTKQWHQDYIEALIDRDLKEIVQIRRKDSLKRLLEILAAWSSKFIDLSAIGAGLGLARPTLEAYINALELLYLVERVSPWHKTDYDRIGKQDKIFMTDTGLMSSVLRWNLDQVRLNGELSGKLLETFVFTQLTSILDAQEEVYQLFHYRDREKREIDFLIEDDQGALLGIEVKAGSSIDKACFKHLIWFRDHLAQSSPFVGVVLYTGEHILSFGEKMWAVPIKALWG